MKSSLTLSTVILSFVIHAAFTGRLLSDSKMILGECYVKEKPLNCKFSEYTMVDTNDDNKWCCLKFVFENGKKNEKNSEVNSIRVPKDSGTLFVSSVFASQNNFDEVSSASSSTKIAMSTQVSKFVSTPSESLSKQTKAASNQLRPQSLSFDNENASNNLTFESSRILNILSSSKEVSVDSTSVDIIELIMSSKTLRDATLETSMSVEESRSTNIQTASTNDFSSFFPSLEATRRKLPARKLSRRARINKTPSSVVIASYSSSSSLMESVASLQENKALQNLSISTFTSLQKKSTGDEGVSSENSMKSEKISSESFNQIEKPEGSGELSEMKKYNSETSTKSEKSQRRVHLNLIKSLIEKPDSSIFPLSSVSRSTQRFKEEFADFASRETLVDTQNESFSEASSPKFKLRIFDAEKNSQEGETSTPLISKKSENLHETISSSPLSTTPERRKSGGELSSENEKLSSAAETSVQSTQTFRAQRYLTTSGQDSFRSLDDKKIPFEIAEDEEAGKLLKKRVNDFAGENYVEETLDDNIIREHLLKPKLRHPAVTKSFNINEFVYQSLEKDPFVAGKLNKEKAQAPKALKVNLV